MPSRNTMKQYDAPSFYHVYNRGAGKHQIFLDDQDRNKFLSLFDRHLDPANNELKAGGFSYEQYGIDVVAYCLMGNHFHLLLYQSTDTTAITKLMKSISTAYVMYFNKKYKQSGRLFQSVFKASHIQDEAYLIHITRYIHMNPKAYTTYRWSSLGAYLQEWSRVWLKPELVNELSPSAYLNFLIDYNEKKEELETIKSLLAK